MYKINKGFIMQKMDKGILIFDPDSSTMHSLNTIGSFIFTKLKKGLGEDEICQMLVEKYLINRKVAEKDFKEFLKELIELKIVEKVG